MNTFNVLFQMATCLRTIVEFRDWVNQCDTCLQLIVEYQCNEELSVASKQSLASLIARTKTLRAIVQARFSRVGLGVSGRSTTPKIVWEDVETAFRNRISTGAVINVGYIDLHKFLEGVRRMVLSRVTDAIKELSGVSVITVLNAEFMLNANMDMKSFGTRNCVLFKTSSVRE